MRTRGPLAALAASLALAAAGFGVHQIISGGSGALPGAGNVFIDPTGGSDVGANCQRYPGTTQTDPGGTVCQSFDKAYTLAQVGDTVRIRSGTFTGQQTIAIAHRKPDGSSCSYLGSQAGCITFRPETTAVVTFNVPNLGTTNLSQLDASCITYLHLMDMTFVDTTYVEPPASQVLSNFAFNDNDGDNACTVAGVGHDNILENLNIGGPINIGSGGYNTCVVNSVATGTHDQPWAIADSYNNGHTPVGVYAHDNCLIGNTFQGYNFQNHNYSNPLHHMECVTMFEAGAGTGGTNNYVIRNNKFLDCPVEGIFLQIDAGQTATNDLFEGNLFVGSAFPLKISCHSSGCQVTNTTVRFNTFNTTSNFTDCNGGCTWTGSTYYGNLNPVCGLTGWSGNHNVFSAASCATDDGTSTFNSTPAYVNAPSPNYNYALANCTQAAAGAVAPGVVAGYPVTDLTGVSRPFGTNYDSGAYESCSTGGVANKGTGGSLATCTGHAGTPADPCAAGTLSAVKTYTADDGQGTNVSFNYYVYKPSGLTGAAPALFVFSGDPGQETHGKNSATHTCSGAVDPARGNCNWFDVADANRFIVVEIPDKPSGSYQFFWQTPQPYPIGGGGCGGSGPCYLRYLEGGATPTVGAACGVNGSLTQRAHCDDTVRVQTLYTRIVCSGASPCEGIDPNKVFAEGESKGAQMTLELMCNPSTSALFRGYIPVSALMETTGTTSSATPACPAVTGASPNQDFSFDLQQGTNDSLVVTNCTPIPTCAVNGGIRTDHQNWRFGIADQVQKIVNLALGCSNTPTSTTGGSTGQVAIDTYTGCAVGIRAARTESYNNAGHAYDNLGFFNSYDSLNAAWNFMVAH